MGMTSIDHKDDINLEEFDDVLHDTFAPKEKKDKDENKEGEDGEASESPAVPDAPIVENEMTLTE